jgi:hypothetical protein
LEQDILKPEYRKFILDEIYSEENISRKRVSFQNSEIFNKRAKPFIDAKLEAEFKETASEMRKLYSINIAQRMTEKMASVYSNTPTRTFHDQSGKELSEEQNAFLNDAYEKGSINSKLAWANQVERFQNQTFLQILPVNGVIGMRVYQPHQIDVIPKVDDPETAEVYIVSAYDRGNSLISGDSKDQKIGDKNDRQTSGQREKNMHVWWSEKYNFITDGNGKIMAEPGKESEVENPIKMLPFVELASRKENEFFVRAGNGIIEFALEFAVILSDVANINRLQGYAQGVISDYKKPSEVISGPNRWIFMQLVEGATVQPSAQFISPTPDLASSLKLLDQLLNYALTAEGVDPKSITSGGDGKSYSSALERFLAQIEAFEPSKKDLDMFRTAEAEVFKILVAWANHYNGAKNSKLTKLEGQVTIPDGAYLQIQFGEPELVQSPTEAEAREKTRIEMGVSSKVMAVMELYGLDEEGAVAHLKKAREHEAQFAQEGQGAQSEEVQVQASKAKGREEQAAENEAAQSSEGGRAAEADGRGVA